MFSIFESVIIFFLKHRYFRMFCCKFMKKSCVSAKQDIWRFVKSLGRWRMKIQEASEDVTEGGIMFPSSRTSYMEVNTQKGEETYIFSTWRTHMPPSVHNGGPGAEEITLGCRSHESMCLAPESSLTCAWSMVLGT